MAEPGTGPYTMEGVSYDLHAGEPGQLNPWNSPVIEWSTAGKSSGKSLGDRRNFGVFGDYNTLVQLHNAVNQGNVERSVQLLNQLKSSPYGALGTPYRGKLPEKLDDNIQLTISAPKARIDYVIEEMQKTKGNLGLMQRALGQMYKEARDMLWNKRPKTARLTEVRPGVFQWTKWQDNPEWKAYKEGMAETRRSAAQARQAAVGQERGAIPMMQSGGQYAQLQSLFAAHEGDSGPRPGQTAATKPGAVPYSDAPGYIGMQAAAYSPQAQKQADDYEY